MLKKELENENQSLRADRARLIREKSDLEQRLDELEKTVKKLERQKSSDSEKWSKLEAVLHSRLAVITSRSTGIETTFPDRAFSKDGMYQSDEQRQLHHLLEVFCYKYPNNAIDMMFEKYS